MMAIADREYRLRVLARTALTRFQGDIDHAMQWLDEQLVVINDAALERALSASYRTYAMRRLLNINFADLQAEGVLPKQREEPADPAQPAAQTWAHDRLRDMQQRVETRRRNYLDEFLIHGEPIGDLTPETVLARADISERDACFMRLMASGVPHGHRIREFVTEDEAAERWKMARESAPMPPADPRPELIMRMLTRGRTMRPDEYQAAQIRVAELHGITNRTTWDDCELDALARVMSEYEHEQR